jgi:hypothetical protein
VDIGAWLDGLGLGQYSRAFIENDIDSEQLRDLTAEDLRAWQAQTPFNLVLEARR